MTQPLSAGLLLACLCAASVGGAYFGGIYETSVYWHPPLELVEYASYRSARLLEYVIPDASAEAWWDFKAFNLHEKCEVRNVIIYIQHGGYPVINPLNSTFPENFHLNRTKFSRLDLKTDNSSTPFVILNPLPGSWFASVVLLSNGGGHIGQKGLTGKSCSYGISATVVSTVRKDVIDISVSDSPRLTLKATDSDKIYRYQLPGEVHHYTVIALNCTYSTGNSSEPCPFFLSVNTLVLADSSTSPNVVDCLSHPAEECTLRVNSPAVNRWSYLQVMWSQGNVSHDSDVSFVLEFKMYGCQSFVGLSRSIAQAYPIRMKNSPRTGTVVYHYSQGTTKVLPSDDCHLMPNLGRLSMVKKDFTTAFVFSSPYFVPMPVNTRAIPDTMSLLTSFEIKHMIDTGGTLKLLLHMDPKHLAPSQMATVSMCAQKDFLPASIANSSERVDCSQGILLSVDSTRENTTIMRSYIPYPESGIWFLTLSSRCFNKDAYNNGSVVYEPCEEGGTPRAEFSVTVGQCVDGKCGSHGTCREYISGVYVFSSCDCSGGWRGYGCTDGSKADSLAEELAAVLLLTLSNLFFLPAVILGVYRRFFVEAMVYGFTMFFSTFYHACDLYGMFCMMNYNVLSYCDFYGSILSFWVTLLAMARLHPTVRSLFHMAGALGLALGVEYDRHGLWVFVTPVVCGVIVMAASWGRMCCGRRSLYPSWKRYLFFLLPGVVCAGTGLIIFAFVETTENYKYTHSAWHAVMAISILFLLPPRRKQKGTPLNCCSEERCHLEAA